MAWGFNPVTGKFEQRKSNQSGTGQQQPTAPKSKGGLNPATQMKRTVGGVDVGAGPPAPGGALPPVAKPRQNVAKVDTSGPQAGPAMPKDYVVPASYWDEQIKAIQDEAYAYNHDAEGNITGDPPPAAWYELKLLPINIQLEERQRRLKEINEQRERDAAAAAAAARGAAAKAEAERERVRAIRAGRQAEANLRSEAERIKGEAIKRIAGLYDPIQTRSEDELKRSLSDVATAFSNAETQVRGAGTMFAESFKPSEAYQDIPVASYQVADNPLLAALQQQGAGTGEVSAATGLARQSAEQASALEKWAAGQLGTSQKNYEEAMRRASSGGVTAALQDLATRRPVVESGIRSEYRKILDELARERASAEAEAGSDYDAAIAAANKLRADTTANYAKVGPKQKTKPKANQKPKPNTGGKKQSGNKPSVM